MPLSEWYSNEDNDGINGMPKLWSQFEKESLRWEEIIKMTIEASVERQETPNEKKPGPERNTIRTVRLWEHLLHRNQTEYSSDNSNTTFVL